MRIHRACSAHFLLLEGKSARVFMPRSPTLLVLGALALLLLWSAAAGWSCRPRVRACRHGGVGRLQVQSEDSPAPQPGQTHIVPKPLASHNLNNREIHGTSRSSGGGLRAILGEMADINRSKACICTRPFCQHPQGQARRGHEEVQLTQDQQALYYPSAEGWVCDDLLFPQGDSPPNSGDNTAES